MINASTIQAMNKVNDLNIGKLKGKPVVVVCAYMQQHMEDMIETGLDNIADFALHDLTNRMHRKAWEAMDQELRRSMKEGLLL